MPDSSLVALGELTKPATVLIERISDAVGGVFKPYQVVRVAKAEAEAEVIRAEAQIQITDLQRRAMHRFLVEEGKKQANIEGVASGAVPLLASSAKPEELETDWIANFFEKGRIVSDREMQQIWSRVLAGQANAPGSFSKRTVNLLGDLEKSDAELFSRLCCFGWTIQGLTPLITSVDDSIYQQNGVDFVALSHLETLGLIQFNNLAGFRVMGLPKRFHIVYFDRALELTCPNDAGNDLAIGRVMLTRAGRELGRVCNPSPVDGFFEFMQQHWEAKGLISK